MRALDETRQLLVRWHEGSQEAMAELVRQEQAFVTAHVRRRLGSLLRRQHDTQDIVQQTMLQALRSAPRFLLSDRDQLRGLLARMVENTLRATARQQQRHKRDVRREQPMEPLPVDTSGSVIDLDPPSAGTDPGAAADRGEVRAWVRLAIELLDADDREVIVLREYEQLSFGAIAERLGEAPDTVRMRHRRALPKLAAAMTKLRSGRLQELL